MKKGEEIVVTASRLLHRCSTWGDLRACVCTRGHSSGGCWSHCFLGRSRGLSPHLCQVSCYPFRCIVLFVRKPLLHLALAHAAPGLPHRALLRQGGAAGVHSSATCQAPARASLHPSPLWISHPLSVSCDDNAVSVSVGINCALCSCRTVGRGQEKRCWQWFLTSGRALPLENLTNDDHVLCFLQVNSV